MQAASKGSLCSVASAKNGLIVHSEKPYNAEPPLERLRASIKTTAAQVIAVFHDSTRSGPDSAFP